MGKQLLLLAIVLSASSCTRLETVDVGARVFAVEGEAALVRRGETVPRPVQLDQAIAAGDTIRTGRAASVGISLLPGVRTTVLADSEVTIISLEIRKSGEAVDDPMRHRHAQIYHARGTLCGSIAELDGDSEASLSVATPVGTALAESGAVFLLRSTEEASEIVCAREQIDFTTNRDNIHALVEEGGAINITASGATPVTEIQPGSREADEMSFALEAERSAVKWEDTVRNQIPVPGRQSRQNL